MVAVVSAAAEIGSTVTIETSKGPKRIPKRPVATHFFRGSQGHVNSGWTCLAIDMVNRANVYIELKFSPEMWPESPVFRIDGDPLGQLRGRRTRQELITRREIAEILEISVPAVKSRLFEARKLLRKKTCRAAVDQIRQKGDS